MNTVFIMQGLAEDENHFDYINKVFSIPSINKGLIATAFINSDGAEALVSILGEKKSSVEIFIGIRNGVTTKQAVELLLNNGISPYLVDTATQSFIFHPKVYIANNDELARVLIGSANATSGGIEKNIEASLYSELSVNVDSEMIHKIYGRFNELKSLYPQNVFQINPSDLSQLSNDGLLIDEKDKRWFSQVKTNKNETAQRNAMVLHTKKLTKARNIQANPCESISIASSSVLWKSGKLKRRDLNIPTGNNTNKTGSMLLKKGDPSQSFDQRTYFRQVVFADENWKFDTRKGKTHIERCTCKFRFIIKGVDFGVYNLELSHNTDTNSKSYKQKNSMTQIHWKDTVSFIAREDLLNAICTLYKADNEGVYILSFDIDE